MDHSKSVTVNSVTTLNIDTIVPTKTCVRLLKIKIEKFRRWMTRLVNRRRTQQIAICNMTCEFLRMNRFLNAFALRGFGLEYVCYGVDMYY